MISRRRLKRRLEDLEAAAEEVRDQLAELADDLDGRASDDDGDDQDEDEDEEPCATAGNIDEGVREVLEGLESRLAATEKSIRAAVKCDTDKIHAKVDEANRQLGVTAHRIETQDTGVLLRGADALKKAANDLLRVPDIGVSSVFVVKDRGAGVSQMTGIFPAVHLEEAKALAATSPGLVVCAAVFHGSIRIGDVLP